jgi:hypothetical protein
MNRIYLQVCPRDLLIETTLQMQAFQSINKRILEE